MAHSMGTSDTPMYIYNTPKGFYPITDEYIQNQPRLAMGVVLKPVDKAESDVRERFIDACIAKD